MEQPQTEKGIMDMIKSTPEAVIAAMARDIHYMSQAIGKMETSLQNMDAQYVKQGELREIQKDRDEQRKDLLERIIKLEDIKLDEKDFLPFKNTLTRINWIVISAIVLALLALILK